MAWANPTTWVSGQTVTAALMNQEVRDNFKHIAGTAGFTATPSATVGIQPSAGYFAGAEKANYHIEGGSISLTTNATGTAYSFANAYAAAPFVTITLFTTGALTQNVPILTAVSTTGFSAACWTPTSGYWQAWGSDT